MFFAQVYAVLQNYENPLFLIFTLAGFIGDLIILIRSFVECEGNIKLIVTLLYSLRLVVRIYICPS